MMTRLIDEEELSKLTKFPLAILWHWRAAGMLKEGRDYRFIAGRLRYTYPGVLDTIWHFGTTKKAHSNVIQIKSAPRTANLDWQPPRG